LLRQNTFDLTCIFELWGRRVDRYSEERADLATLQNAPKKIEMYQIGG